MKKLLPLALLLLLTGCASPDDTSEQIDAAPIPEIALDENGNLITPTEGTETTEVLPENTDEITICREENANMSLELESAQTQIQNCQADLAEAETKQCAEVADVGSIPPQFAQYVKQGILSEEQKEYAFSTCGQMSQFLRRSWFSDFSTKLLAQKIRFSNGYLETTDFLGGCESTAGKMAFFLGAERGDELKFFLVKYDFTSRELISAMMFDGAETAIVTELGKRDGSVVNFTADDGRTLKYYYDANIVIAVE